VWFHGSVHAFVSEKAATSMFWEDNSVSAVGVEWDSLGWVVNTAVLPACSIKGDDFLDQLIDCSSRRSLLC